MPAYYEEEVKCKNTVRQQQTLSLNNKKTKIMKYISIILTILSVLAIILNFIFENQQNKYLTEVISSVDKNIEKTEIIRQIENIQKTNILQYIDMSSRFLKCILSFAITWTIVSNSTKVCASG